MSQIRHLFLLLIVVSKISDYVIVTTHLWNERSNVVIFVVDYQGAFDLSVQVVMANSLSSSICHRMNKSIKT